MYMFVCNLHAIQRGFLKSSSECQICMMHCLLLYRVIITTFILGKSRKREVTKPTKITTWEIVPPKFLQGAVS